jgi:hypothetical protein
MAKRKKDKISNNDLQNIVQKRSSNTSPTENWGELRKGGQFLFHM